MATPKIIPYEVQLRSTKIKRNITRPVVYTNDLRSAEFQFEITDMEPGELSTATATTLLYMRDGSFFQNPKEDVSLVGTTFSYTLKENEGNHGGLAQIQLVVTVSGMEFATQLFDFEIINGLETKVAQEVMIYDWTTLTREARAYIDEFAANEILREAEFDNNEFDRNAAFSVAQTNRTNQFNELVGELTSTLEAAYTTLKERLDAQLAEKANKVQEAWITPTLLNGFTGDIQYRKNEFGRVEFKGSIVTTVNTSGIVFNFPVGYGLTGFNRFSLPDTTGANKIIEISTTYFYVFALNDTLRLDTFSYSVGV